MPYPRAYQGGFGVGGPGLGPDIASPADDLRSPGPFVPFGTTRAIDSLQVTDVTARGAKGDGATDDTAAIQEAIDSTPDGCVIYFPAGIYLVEDLRINQRRGLTFLGDGPGSMLRRGAFGLVVMEGAPAPSLERIATFTQCDSLRLHYLGVDARGLPSTTAGVLAFVDCSTVVVERCVFDDTERPSLTLRDDQLWDEDLWVEMRSALDFRGAAAPLRNICVRDNRVGGLGLSFHNVEQVWISGNTLVESHMNAILVGADGTGQVHRDIRITGNDIIDPQIGAIAVADARFVASDCVMERVVIAHNRVVKALTARTYAVGGGIRVGALDWGREAAHSNAYRDIRIEFNEVVLNYEDVWNRGYGVLVQGASDMYSLHPSIVVHYNPVDRLIVRYNCVLKMRGVDSNPYAIELQDVANAMVVHNYIQGVKIGLRVDYHTGTFVAENRVHVEPQWVNDFGMVAAAYSLLGHGLTNWLGKNAYLGDVAGAYSTSFEYMSSSVNPYYGSADGDFVDETIISDPYSEAV